MTREIHILWCTCSTGGLTSQECSKANANRERERGGRKLNAVKSLRTDGVGVKFWLPDSCWGKLVVGSRGEGLQPIREQLPVQRSITLCHRDRAMPQLSFYSQEGFQWTIGCAFERAHAHTHTRTCASPLRDDRAHQWTFPASPFGRRVCLQP